MKIYRTRILNTQTIPNPDAPAREASAREQGSGVPEQIRVGQYLYTRSQLPAMPMAGTAAAGVGQPLAPQGTVAAAQPGKEDGPERLTLAHIAKNSALGLGSGAAAVRFTTIGQTTSQAQLAGTLGSYGLSPGAAEVAAAKALEFSRSHAGKITCVMLAGSAITLGAVEAFKPEWPWRTKLLLAAAGGAALVIVALVLMLLGVWGVSDDQGGSDASGAAAVETPVGGEQPNAAP